jgi:malonyl-CoA O-methyltransferase
MSATTPPRDDAALPKRALDGAAVDAALRRIARQPQPPWLHAEVERRMAERLAIVRLQPATVLEWWGHTGASGALLAEACPKAHRIVVEPTDDLARRSRIEGQAPWWSVRRWARASEVRRDEPAPASAQLLWSNMMLHAEPDPPALFARWQRLLEVDGFLMFSCLGPGSLRELRELYRRLGWPPPAPEFVDMHDLGDMLVHSGFADPVMDQETLTLTWDGPQALLAELRSLGGNASPMRWRGLRTPRWRERLHAELNALAGTDGRLRLSFEIVYGHAFKAAPRAQPTDRTTVSLEDMRAMVRAARGGRR